MSHSECADAATPDVRAAALEALGPQAQRPCDIVVVARPETLTAPFDLLVGELSVAIERARPQGQGRRPRPAPGPAAGKTRGKGGERPPRQPLGPRVPRPAQPSARTGTRRREKGAGLPSSS